jgi:class 3 adenylate cyclase
MAAQCGATAGAPMVDARSAAQCGDDGLPPGLAEYLPRWVKRACHEWGEAAEPEQRLSRASVLFLDIVGFSKHTTRLASIGPKGAEDLSDLLNEVFSQIVGVIDAMQGDIVAFVGDGVVALWDSGDLIDDARRAVSCGLALQRSAPSTFRMRVSIDCGEVRYCRVGGTGGRWRYLVVGDPIANVGAAYRRAASGETVACPQARAIQGAQLKSARVLHEVQQQGRFPDSRVARDANDPALSTRKAAQSVSQGWPSPVAAFRLESISAPVRLFASHKTIGRERERRLDPAVVKLGQKLDEARDAVPEKMPVSVAGVSAPARPLDRKIAPAARRGSAADLRALDRLKRVAPILKATRLPGQLLVDFA